MTKLPADKKPPKWPADKVGRRVIDVLIPAARNARTHSDEQIAQIAASIKEFGWTVPVLCDAVGGTIIAGHGRVLAAKLLGLEEVPVMWAEGWSDEKKRAYAIADNKLPLNADWDLEALKIELGELKDMDFDLGLIGFSDIELSSLLAESIAADPESEWQGMPEFSHEDKTAFQRVVVHFPDQKAVDDFAALVKMQITPDTRFLWFPETAIDRYADKKYKGDES